MTRASRPASRDLIGTVLLGRYRILRHLADGGMGSIYLARGEGSAGFVRPVVIKCILPSHLADERIATMFAREARIMSQLRHPGIVSVIDFADEGDLHVMVLEYVHGFHLGRWQKFIREVKGQRFPVEIATYLTLQVARALHHAHTLKSLDGTPLNIIHRDVTPSNILIDVDGHCKLADFGIARMSSDHTEVGAEAIKGKFAYMAPEILEQLPPSPSSDLYSLGLVLHELLLGSNEFRCETMPATVTKVMSHVPTRIDTVRGDLPAGLADVVERSLQKNPQDRYTSAEEFAADVSRCLTMSEGDAAKELANQASADFRDARMAQLLAVPELSDLESTWTTPVRGPGQESTRKTDGLEGTTPRGLAHSPQAAAQFEAETVISHQVPTVETAPPKRSLRLFLGIAATLFVVGIGVVAVLALLKSTGGRKASEPAYIVVSDREKEAADKAPDQPEPVGVSDADAAAMNPTTASADAGASKTTTLPPRPSKDDGSAKPRKPESQGASLTRTFGRRRGKIATCFRANSKDAVNGAISVRFKLDKGGVVKSAAITPASLRSTALGKCILDVAKKTKFGRQPKGIEFLVPIHATIVE